MMGFDLDEEEWAILLKSVRIMASLTSVKEWGAIASSLQARLEQIGKSHGWGEPEPPSFEQ